MRRVFSRPLPPLSLLRPPPRPPVLARSVASAPPPPPAMDDAPSPTGVGAVAAPPAPMRDPLHVLGTFWGYSKFRACQEVRKRVDEGRAAPRSPSPVVSI